MTVRARGHFLFPICIGPGADGTAKLESADPGGDSASSGGRSTFNELGAVTSISVKDPNCPSPCVHRGISPVVLWAVNSVV